MWWCTQLAAIAVVVLLQVSLGTPAQADVWLRRDGSGALGVKTVPAPSGRGMIGGSAAMRGPAAAIIHRRAARYEGLITAIAARHGVEAALVKAVIRAESGFNPRAVSPKGARGLMQLMPATARRHNVRNVFSPQDNIEGGVEHLRLLLDKYRGDVRLALAAYNAGTRAVAAAGLRIPPYRETRRYVRRVLSYRRAYRRSIDGRWVASNR